MSVQRKEPIISIVVAVSKNGVIGRDGDMPWRLSSDLKRFKSITLGKPVIMGRKTFESIGRLLPGRLNVIVSRSGYSVEGAKSAKSLEEALELAGEIVASEGGDEICIIGGGQIYKSALDLADKLYVTHVMAEIDGDTHFPEIVSKAWKPVEKQMVPAGEKDSHETMFVVYERV